MYFLRMESLRMTDIMRKKIIFPFLVATLIVVFSGCLSASTYNDTEHWAKEYINYITDMGYSYGVTSTEFAPDKEVTRGMFITVLARYDGVDLDNYNMSPFYDIAQENYYTKPAIWAHENDIVKGVTKERFYPDEYITREQVATMLLRYIDDGTIDGFGADYNDWNDVSKWAKDGVAAMTERGLFVGYDGSFRPKEYMTRAEMAVLFCRLDGKEFPIYKPKEEKLAYIGTYKITYYCAGCAGTITASGKRATVGRTVALPRSMWSQWSIYKGRTVYIENIGYRVIEDKCGTGAFDIFCSGGCGNQPFNVTRQKIYLVD